MDTKLTVTAPTGAFCHLHTGVLTSMKFSDIDPQTAIPVTQTVIRSDRTVYCYEGLEPGNYHFCAVLDGFTSVCQLIDHTGDTAIDIHMDRQAGTGYEKGYILCPTPEFTKNCFPSRKDTWGEAYTRLFRTPQFLRKVFSHQQTTNEELQAFIRGLSCPYPHISAAQPCTPGSCGTCIPASRQTVPFPYRSPPHSSCRSSDPDSSRSRDTAVSSHILPAANPMHPQIRFQKDVPQGYPASRRKASVRPRSSRTVTVPPCTGWDHPCPVHRDSAARRQRHPDCAGFPGFLPGNICRPP